MKRRTLSRTAVLAAALVALSAPAGELPGSEQPQIPQQYQQAAGLPTGGVNEPTADAPVEPVVSIAIPRGVLGVGLNRAIVFLPLPLGNPWLEPEPCGDGGILGQCPD